MWTNPFALTAGLTLAVSCTLAEPTSLYARQPQAPATEEQQFAIYRQAFTDPVGAARAALAQPYIVGQASTGNLYSHTLVNDNQQLPWNQGVYFQPEAQVGGSVVNGWQFLPEIPGFNLNRSTVIRDGAVMPFYVSANRDPAKIKRAVMVMPGKPRDSWKYTSLVQNALNVAATNASSGVTNDSVLIIGPCWLNTDDRRAGALKDNELVWYGTQWQRGDESRGPGKTAISSYEVLDFFLDHLFDKNKYPSLNRVVVAGHSMGAQMVQRYAMLKATKPYDKNVHYWAGNPGSFVWPTSERPVENATCTTGDIWPYGLDGAADAPEIAQEQLDFNKRGVAERYRSRNVHLNLGLLDNGPGDTSCEAGLQGANHLERGSRHVEALAAMSGGYPARHTVNFMPRVSHQDYAMLSYNISLWRLFADRLDSAEPEDHSGPGSSAITKYSNSGSSNAARALIPILLGALGFGFSVLLSW